MAHHLDPGHRLADGRPLRILSGRSYIAWLSSLTGEEVTVQDSVGNDLLQP